MAGALLALSLACSGGESGTDAATDAVTDAATDAATDKAPEPEIIPVPVPTPDRGEKVRRPPPGRDRSKRPPRKAPPPAPGGDRDKKGGGGGGDNSSDECAIKNVFASSTFAGTNADNVFDNNDRTAWCEGDGGTGVGESVTIELGQACTFNTIEIVAGDFRDPASLKKHSRVKRLMVTNTEGGEHAFELPDVGDRPFDEGQQPLYLEFPKPITAKTKVTIRIDAVYPGTESVACISTAVPLK